MALKDRDRRLVRDRLQRAAELLQNAADIIWMATRDANERLWPKKTDWRSCCMGIRHKLEGDARFLEDLVTEIPRQLGEEHVETLMQPKESK